MAVRCVASLLLPSLLTVGWAHAQTSPESTPDRQRTLPSVTVTGERPTTPRDKIDVDDLVRRGQASDVRELFKKEANADIGGGTRNGQRVYLRGIEGSQLNITIDGARQGANLYNHRGGLNNVDPEILKRLEVNTGPPAADDGYGALGGSVRFETIDAQDRLGPGERAGGLVKLGTASADSSLRGAAAGYGLVGDKIGLLVYTTYNDFDDLRIGGGGRIPFSAGTDQTRLFKLSALDMGPHSFRLSIEDNDANGFNFQQRGDFPYQIQPAFNVRPPQDQTLRRTALTARYDFNPGLPWWRVRATAADSKTDFFAPNSMAERFISKVRNYDLRNEFTFDLGALTNRTTVGVDYFEDRQSSAFLNRATTFTGTDNTGLYLQSRLTGKSHAFEVGVRRDRWDTDFSARDASNAATSFNAKGEVALGGGFTLFGGVGESARGYSTIPLQFTRNIGTTLTLNGSASHNLRSERSRVSEIGSRWEGQNALAQGDRAGVALKAYDIRIRDAILYRQPGSGGLGGRPVTDFFNNDTTTRFHGVEVSGDYARGNYNGSLSIARPKVSNLPADPQFIARFGAPTGGKLVWDNRYSVLPGVTLGYTLTAVRRLNDVQSNQIVFIPRAGYILHDVQVVYQPTGIKGWSLGLAINNLSDKRYSSQATFTERGFATEDAGRNLRLTASLTF